MHSSPISTCGSDLRSQLNTRFHGPLMSFFLRRIRDRTQAEDFTQEVFLRVIRASQVEPIERADSFVFKVAMNVLRDFHRRTRRNGNAILVPLDDALSDDFNSQLVEDISPERVLLSRDSLAEALHALNELGERTRNIFVLFRLENMKQKDIAAYYGIAQSTVEKHVVKAVLHLAARCGKPKSRAD
jgi:RNA polymerase sigma-70 factor (ECF subfamily)